MTIEMTWKLETYKKYIPRIFIYISFISVGLYLLISGPSFTSDSSSYLRMSPHRSGGYPLFLSIFNIFGEFKLYLVVLVQTIICGYSFHSLLKFISIQYDINKFYIVLFIPLIVYFWLFEIDSSKIMIESISFPLFIIFVVHIVGYIERGKTFNLWLSLVTLSLLIFLRGHFLFIYPVIFLFIVYKFINDKELYKFLKLILMLICSLLFGYFLSYSYHYFTHGKFTNTPFSNWGLVTNTLYVSTDETFSKMDLSAEEKKLFVLTHDSLSRNVLTKESYLELLKINNDDEIVTRSDIANHYHDNFNTILHTILIPIINNKYILLDNIESYKKVDDLFQRYSVEFIKRYPDKFIEILILDVLVNGFHHRLILILYITITFLALIFSIKKILLFQTFLFFLFMHFSNIFLVAIAGRILPRYTMYTLFFILVYLIIIVIKNKYND